MGGAWYRRGMATKDLTKARHAQDAWERAKRPSKAKLSSSRTAKSQLDECAGCLETYRVTSNEQVLCLQCLREEKRTNRAQAVREWQGRQDSDEY